MKYLLIIAALYFSVRVFAARTMTAPPNQTVKGLRVDSSDQDGLYHRLGLREGDIIQKFNGQEISAETEASDFYKSLSQEKVIELVFLRDGKPVRLNYKKYE